jgi:hypothetical protein
MQKITSFARSEVGQLQNKGLNGALGCILRMSTKITATTYRHA